VYLFLLQPDHQPLAQQGLAAGRRPIQFALPEKRRIRLVRNAIAVGKTTWQESDNQSGIANFDSRAAKNITLRS
jgi:hypothetical protein